jgi:hypothetical protein
MLGERNTLERFTVRAEEEEDRWGTRGINTPRSENSNGHISEFETSEKNLGTSDL